MAEERLIVVRGGGDIASGTIHRLFRCRFRVLVLETDAPKAIRRTVSFAEAVYEGQQSVEGVTAELAASLAACGEIWQCGHIPVLVDPKAESLARLAPLAVIDAILAKRNCGTRITMAPVTIALGPGFRAGVDVHAVIETARGHDLGRVIFSGCALANTGIPGAVEGYTSERVLYAPQEGILTVLSDIGSRVDKGQLLADIDGSPVYAPIPGLVRGMLRSGSLVQKDLKIADIDPRSKEQVNCYTISDKARCISGGVIEALLVLLANTPSQQTASPR